LLYRRIYWTFTAYKYILFQT